jgi:hypothetical protein
MMRSPGRIGIGIGLSIAVATLAAQDRPLPDQECFLEETRKHLQTDSALQSSYVYVETRREQKLDKQGRVNEESIRVFESYPGLPGEARWERLTAENGRPVPPEELAKQDRNRQAKAAAMVRRLAENGPKERARQEREYQKARRERDEAVGDIYTVFDIRMIGRDRIEGHDAIAFSLTPRPGARPRTTEGRQMQHFKVQAWISESDYELVKLDAEAIDTLSFGLGVLARLHKGRIVGVFGLSQVFRRHLIDSGDAAVEAEGAHKAPRTTERANGRSDSRPAARRRAGV